MTLSPFFRVVHVPGASLDPFTNVPFVEPKSDISQSDPFFLICPCLPETYLSDASSGHMPPERPNSPSLNASFHPFPSRHVTVPAATFPNPPSLNRSSSMLFRSAVLWDAGFQPLKYVPASTSVSPQAAHSVPLFGARHSGHHFNSLPHWSQNQLSSGICSLQNGHLVISSSLIVILCLQPVWS